MQGGNESQQTKMKQHAAAFGLVGFIYLFVGGLPLLAVAGAMQDCLVSTDAGGCGEMAGCIWTGDSAGTAAAALAAAALGGGAEEGAGKCVQGRLNQNFLISDLQPWPSVWVSGMLHDVVRFAGRLSLSLSLPRAALDGVHAAVSVCSRSGLSHCSRSRHPTCLPRCVTQFAARADGMLGGARRCSSAAAHHDLSPCLCGLPRAVFHLPPRKPVPWHAACPRAQHRRRLSGHRRRQRVSRRPGQGLSPHEERV
eukprot:969315-Rhodomonas_salina.1